MNKQTLLFVVFVLFVVPPVFAHPVPKEAHDRTIVVHLTPDAVVVNYRVEVDDWTVTFIDLPAIDDRVDLKKLTKSREFYDAFVEGYASIFANNFTATLDGRPLTFTCVKRDHQLIDHLRCDFTFRAPWQLRPGASHQLAFREGNYEGEVGRINLSLTSDVALLVGEVTQPDEALKLRPPFEYRPGDEAKLRKASAAFSLAWANKPAPETKTSPSEPEPEASESPRYWIGAVALLVLAVVFAIVRAARGVAAAA